MSSVPIKVISLANAGGSGKVSVCQFAGLGNSYAGSCAFELVLKAMENSNQEKIFFMLKSKRYFFLTDTRCKIPDTRYRMPDSGLVTLKNCPGSSK
jgi:hypothetical protein